MLVPFARTAAGAFEPSAATSTGNVSSVPPPAMELTAPARAAEVHRSRYFSMSSRIISHHFFNGSDPNSLCLQAILDMNLAHCEISYSLHAPREVSRAQVWHGMFPALQPYDNVVYERRAGGDGHADSGAAVFTRSVKATFLRTILATSSRRTGDVLIRHESSARRLLQVAADDR